MRKYLAAILLAGAEGSWYYDSEAIRQLRLMAFGFSDAIIGYLISDDINWPRNLAVLCWAACKFPDDITRLSKRQLVEDIYQLYDTIYAAL